MSQYHKLTVLTVVIHHIHTSAHQLTGIRHTVCPWPILYSNLLFKMGHYFLDTQIAMWKHLMSKSRCSSIIIYWVSHDCLNSKSRWTRVWIHRFLYNTFRLTRYARQTNLLQSDMQTQSVINIFQVRSCEIWV